jgi:hypothetical protein
MTVSNQGRKLLRLEVRNSQTPVERKPPWMKVAVRTGPRYRELSNLVKRNDVHTVCQEAGCPNIFEGRRLAGPAVVPRGMVQGQVPLSLFSIGSSHVGYTASRHSA